MNLAIQDEDLSESAHREDPRTLDTETELGSSIGPYTLRSILGEGGMGVVYLASQDDPIKRDVALKVIKIGMDSREVMRRFAIERQTLAIMEHPNIARVFDAGTTPRGRPFFVMEYVPGAPITDYCDSRRRGVEDRIELFTAVCEAVQHAHLKGVIHRDLKPSNVIVTEIDGRAVPKVIDFGLAKATGRRLEDRATLTQFGHLIGTPEYMSPEQAGLVDGDIDTRTDVYSLGILLYEIIAGVPPMDAAILRNADLEKLLRQIREVPSPRPSTRVSSLGDRGAAIARDRGTDPSTLMRRLRGDLDRVVMKAIEKDRSRRYATVRDLASDLRRYLNHDPVEAGPPGSMYRLGKFARRHRLGVVAAGCVLFVLLLGVAGTTLGWIRAFRAEQRAVLAEVEAREEAEAAGQVSRFLVDLFQASRPGNVPVETITAPDILARGAEKIREDLGGQPIVQARMMSTIADVYRSLGLSNEAMTLAEEALRIRRRELPPDHIDRSRSMAQIGSLQMDQGLFEEAERSITAAEAIQNRTLGAEDARRMPTLTSLLTLYLNRSRYQDAESVARRLLAIGEKAHGPDSPELANIQANLGIALMRLGRLDEAEPILVEAVENMRKLRGDEHVDYAMAAHNLASVYQRLGRLDEVIPLQKRVIEIQEANLGPAHPAVADSLNILAINHAMQGKYEEAAPLFMRRLEIYEELYGPEHPAVGRTLANVGNIQRDLGNYAEAEDAYKRALAILEQTVGPETADVAMTCGNLAGIYSRLSRNDEALALHRRALTIREKSLGPEHPRTAMSLDNVAAVLRDMGRLEEAEPDFLRAFSIRKEVFPEDHPLIAKSLHGIAVLYHKQGREQEAIDAFQKAIEIREKSLGVDHPHLARSLNALAVLHRDRGRFEEAETLFRQALAIMEAKYGAALHPDTREILEGYAVLLLQTDRPREAAKVQARAHSIGTR